MNYLLNRTPILIFCLCFLLVGCKKDDITPIDIPNNPDTSSNPLYSGNTVTTSIGGLVTNQSGVPVSNALVTVGNKTGFTNDDGIFNFTNVSVDENRAYVKINKSGYFLGSRSFKPNASYNNYVRIELISKSVTGTFDNSSGGTININGGAELTFQAGDLSLSNGTIYMGDVTVYATYLDPMAPNIGKIMPGDLIAVDNSNDAVALETYGMIVVELVGSSGEPLNVAQGKTVEIRMPVAAQQMASAPSLIPLWYFNEEQGNWVEEGQATLQGSNYIGQVSHFSFWNCDAPFPLIDFHCRIVCDGVPMSNTMVSLTTADGGQNYGVTDANGEVNGGIPMNTSLTLDVIDECESIVYTQSIPASSSNIDLGNISACNSGNQVAISGTVIDCEGEVVTNGLLRITFGTTFINIFTNQNGDFNTVLNTCSFATIDITTFDLDNATQSNVMTVQTDSPVNLGEIIACNQIEEFITYTIDGTSYSVLDLGQNEVMSSYHIDSTIIDGSNWPDYIRLKLSNPSIGSNSCQLRWVNGLNIEYPSIINLNYTELGTSSGTYMEGTFSGVFNEIGGSPSHTISGSFRTKNE